MRFASVFLLAAAVSTNAVAEPQMADSALAFDSWYERRSSPDGDTLLAIARATNVSQTTLEFCASFRFAGGYRPSQESTRARQAFAESLLVTCEARRDSFEVVLPDGRHTVHSSRMMLPDGQVICRPEPPRLPFFWMLSGVELGNEPFECQHFDLGPGASLVDTTVVPFLRDDFRRWPGMLELVAHFRTGAPEVANAKSKSVGQPVTLFIPLP
jgi:hypothetical protein